MPSLPDELLPLVTDLITAGCDVEVHPDGPTIDLVAHQDGPEGDILKIWITWQTDEHDGGYRPSAVRAYGRETAPEQQPRTVAEARTYILQAS
ncbi:hypothetical protein [Marinitenerispora sediminis]|uniref:Uncharacterized protein n=1 Tax=Marinitenerispora sediminis TaxID=1931232 RepID=A0A368T9M2_9ACTN|nr:hypothetical protein [Marinitenerispora sediminis]RCV53453.1 hypothetical protein DEF23_17390 [Marinitenerispora sediminis]RCV59281.1 hypothetical protein DEF24_09930 [Marinitenerispora sediminis]